MHRQHKYPYRPLASIYKLTGRLSRWILNYQVSCVSERITKNSLLFEDGVCWNAIWSKRDREHGTFLLSDGLGPAVFYDYSDRLAVLAFDHSSFLDYKILNGLSKCNPSGAGGSCGRQCTLAPTSSQGDVFLQPDW